MSDVTRLLERWRLGDKDALSDLFPIVYQELRKVANARMKGENGYHTLEPTALIHELFFKLAGQNAAQLKNRPQFFALAARMMRRILIDHARAKRAGKRGGAATPVDLEKVHEMRPEFKVDHLLLDEALVCLADLDPKLCLIVELKHFGGFNMDEISEIVGIPRTTTYRHWKLAKAHLYGFFKEVSVGTP